MTSPPNAEIPQHKDCSEPALAKDSCLTRSTTTESTITSLIATERELSKMAEVAVQELCTTVASASQDIAPKIPDKIR